MDLNTFFDISDLDNFNFPVNEEGILRFWQDNKIYDKIVDKNKFGKEFRFLDGPPFVSSKELHLGHILVSTCKSSILNYKQMKGYNVFNKLGYDVHGLPSECAVMKRLNLKTKKDIEKFGKDTFIQECKNFINESIGYWYPIFNRIGRFFDPKNEYKTMDLDYMETVWWVFKQLWDKDLVYYGFKVMPFSTACSTPLSNFEASGEDVYKDIIDPAVYVKFQLKNEENTYIIAWTTTPWTLPSNLALCVNKNIEYIKIKDLKTKEYYILAEKCINRIYKNSDFEIILKYYGYELENKEYIPLFSYFDDGRIFKIISADFVTSEDGSGIVHLAPVFGEDDFNICLEKKIIDLNEINKFCVVDDEGCFTSKISDYQGLYVRDSNDKIIERLKLEKKLIKKEMFKHKYPFCWRTDTPLIYKAVPSFFIKVTVLKDNLIENNKRIFWVPDHIKNGRFHNWLENVKDWCISRSRFFGTPLPVWVSDDLKEMICVGSIDELVELAQLKDRPKDLHADCLDKIKIPSQQGKGILKRINMVFDCWFESGCVPYGQIHYPFSNKTYFNNVNYISDFICESLDQIRGWFYTLLVLSTALFNKPAFKEVICSGLILAEDGKKFSKKLGNYKPLESLFNEYGADAIRMYLLNSPATHADPFKFNQDDITIIVKKNIQWFNAFKFFVEYYTKYIKDRNTFDINQYKYSKNITDKWILARIHELIYKIEKYMDTYKINKIITEIMNFVEDLTNWYIKFNRNRLRGRYFSLEDRSTALSTLFKVLIEFSKITAPFVPFLSETIYQKLKLLLPTNEQKISIHLCDYPQMSDFPLDQEIIRKMKELQIVAGMVRSIRSRSKNATSAKIPIKTVTIINNNQQFINDIQELERYMNEEINSIHIKYSTLNNIIKYKIQPNHKTIGIKYRNLAPKIKEKIKGFSDEDINNFIEKKSIELIIEKEKIILTEEDLIISKKLDLNLGENEIATIDDETNTIVIVNLIQDEEVISLHIMRLFIVSVQNMRKQVKLKPWNKINIYYKTESDLIKNIINKFYNRIVEELLYNVYSMNEKNIDEKIIISSEKEIYGSKILLTITESQE